MDTYDNPPFEAEFQDDPVERHAHEKDSSLDFNDGFKCAKIFKSATIHEFFNHSNDVNSVYEKTVSIHESCRFDLQENLIEKYALVQNAWFEPAAIFKPTTQGKQFDHLLDYNPRHVKDHESRGSMFCTLSLQIVFYQRMHHKKGK